ncbi:MAG: cyclic nucleotide-binding domain-containing protein [Desulfobacteraceae bacterium]|nr:cyclic nucleotide-binding domain-containing protein [Desulfobacteraceae bacterium]
MKRSEIERIVGGCDLFKGLAKNNIGKIASLCHVETYAAAENVFSQGDFGEHLYVIADGHIVLERSMDLGPRKGSVVTGMLCKGRAFGCWSTLLDEAHNLMSTATCQKPTTVVVLSGAALREMMLSNPKLGFDILENLCFVLRDRMQGAFGAMEKI